MPRMAQATEHIHAFVKGHSMNKRTALAVTTAAATVATLGFTATTASAATNESNAKSIISSWPATGTGGLILRDSSGNDTGSGIGEKQDFEFSGCGPKGSGLIKVVQVKRGGGGGWGSSYSGFVKQKYTQLPSMFPCN